MPKHIVIIGGGISGLTVLHYLNKRFSGRTDIEISLLEKSDLLGGTIHSLTKDGLLFEQGPNGFLDSKPETLDFINELNLKDCLIRADEQAKIRYISLQNRLYPMPTNPKGFLAFQPLSILDKLRVLGEFFIPKGTDPSESVFGFGKRRLGQRFAEIFLDPMVSGIYGGDARTIHLKSAFPRIAQLEQEYGSLFKALFHLKKKGQAAGTSNGTSSGMPTGILTSFQEGMGQMIRALGDRYQNQILLRQEIKAITKEKDSFLIQSRDKRYQADHLFLCTPAYSASGMLRDMNPALASLLERINYAPIAVVGLVYLKTQFKEPPKGFGYLIPSSEGKTVLGVLFDSNIFCGRCPKDKILVRVMLGGSRHPDILDKSEGELLDLAVEEIASVLKATAKPDQTFLTVWPMAIPQYDQAYPELKEKISRELLNTSCLSLAANYLGGISFNDCVLNAKLAVEKLTV